MKLFAISDLHLRHEANRRLLQAVAAHPEDWLIVAGDVGETASELRWALGLLTRRFARVLWVPGNHDLWTPPGRAGEPRGEAKYLQLVEVCREHGVSTPEDEWPLWPGEGPACRIALLFSLYDYTFRPDDVPAEEAVAWAARSGIVCADEAVLHPDPYPSRQAWCAALCERFEERLVGAAAESPLVLVNHWPLRRELVHLRRIPRFTLWCGTRRTADWHTRFGAVAAVHGHLHIKRTHWDRGVLFEEVSLGYPRDWDARFGIEAYLRQILPLPETPFLPARERAGPQAEA